ncbi:hypothetical protein EDD16DRAFT_1484130 [Pisolithus croceorrhizus]|nr:hypothetical protein EDD16DRAFT_1484130 [Pisolithus croceorrhizus]KAI6151382.1 hypothetical protein EDD17DRAFT_1491388 [Pisolithus thermaeus]
MLKCSAPGPPSVTGFLLPAHQPLHPSYVYHPVQTEEHFLAMNHRHRLLGEFIKQSKNGCATLRLSGQDGQASYPVYGLGTSVQGCIDVHRTEGVTSVEVQIEGILKLEQVAGGGTTTYKLCWCKNILWVKDRLRGLPCPNSLRFALSLPTTFSDGEKTFPLPPSYEAHLSGLPGFRAYIHYALTAQVVKPDDVPNMVKSAFLRKDDWAIATPVLYRPRSRPPAAIPPPLVTHPHYGLTETIKWKAATSTILANGCGQGIIVKVCCSPSSYMRNSTSIRWQLHLPTPRIFCVQQPIPFYISFHASSVALALFKPLAPFTCPSVRKMQITRIRLMRQTSVDICNALIFGTKSDMWTVDCIGEAAFKHIGEGSDWLAYSGEVFIANHITLGGFRAGGFSVRDCLVLTVNPTDLTTSPFKEMRMVVPIQFTTDRWIEGGPDLTLYGSGLEIASGEPDFPHELPDQ